jgi:hypothetical protein
MTVCIAVTQRFSTEIVLVTDRLLSSDINSTEGGWKVAWLAPRATWYMMFAGEAHRFGPLVGRMRELLGDIGDSKLTLETVIACAAEAYKREIEDAASDEVLWPYGLSRKEFIENGLNWFGETRFIQLLDRLDAFDLGIDLLVVGLDAWGQTQMFSVSPNGAVTQAVLPYHAIGSGAYLALGSLYPLAYFPGPDLAETVYRACAAKFAAEAAPGVGRETYAIVIEPMAGTWTIVMEVDQLRQWWRTTGQPRFPPAAKRSIDRDLRALRNQLIPLANRTRRRSKGK